MKTKRIQKKYAQQIKEFSCKDKGLISGMVMERKFTDFAFAIVFFVVMALMLVLVGISFAKGKVWQFFDPFDGDLKYCGHEVEGYDYLYLTDLGQLGYMTNAEIQAQSVCVKECPGSANSMNFEFSPTANFTTKPAWLNLYPTSPSPFKVCVPTDPSELTMSEFNGYNNTLGASTGLYQLEAGLEKQLQRSIGVLLFCSVLTVVLNIVYI